MTIDTTDMILAGLGVGGFLWMNNKVNNERRARIAAEHRLDCARACAGPRERPANGNMPASAPKARGLAPRTFDPSSRRMGTAFQFRTCARSRCASQT